MNAKERVNRALRGQPIDRLPMWYGAEPALTKKIAAYMGVSSEEEVLKRLGADFRTIRPRYVGPPLERNADGTFRTVWGILRGGGFWGTALNHPLSNIESIDELKDYPWPDPGQFEVAFNENDLALSREYAIIGGEWAPFYHEAEELLGTEKFLMTLCEDPELCEALLDRCLNFHLEINERLFSRYAKYIDVYWFANDMGSSHGLLMRPDMWREIFKPRQKKLADQGHKYGLKVAYHSCGDISAIIPDLIEIGIDIINPIQVSCPGMNPKKLKEKYADQVVFFGGIDYNQLLSHGTVAEVEEGVRTMIDILGYDRRMIVAPSHDLLMAEVPAENMIALYRTASTYSPKYCSAH
jgi:uroporphyrinogen decarboxylase